MALACSFGHRLGGSAFCWEQQASASQLYDEDGSVSVPHNFSGACVMQQRRTYAPVFACRFVAAPGSHSWICLGNSGFLQSLSDATVYDSTWQPQLDPDEDEAESEPQLTNHPEDVAAAAPTTKELTIK
eukprot:scaffold16294_cov17-Tisochrysis_lutea.AAC.1